MRWDFRERVSRMLLVIGVFGAGGAFLAYRMFVSPAEMMVPWLEASPTNPVFWVGLLASGLMVLMGLYRMAWAPHRVVLDGEELRFGVRGRRRLRRAEVAAVDHRRKGEVLLRLHDPQATLRRLDLLDDLEGVSLYAGEYRHGQELPAAIEDWLAAGGQR